MRDRREKEKGKVKQELRTSIVYFIVLYIYIYINLKISVKKIQGTVKIQKKTYSMSTNGCFSLKTGKKNPALISSNVMTKWLTGVNLDTIDSSLTHCHLYYVFDRQTCVTCAPRI